MPVCVWEKVCVCDRVKTTGVLAGFYIFIYLFFFTDLLLSLSLRRSSAGVKMI